MDDRKLDDITRSLAQATTRRQALRLFGGGALGVAGLAIGAKRADAAPKVSGTSSAVASDAAGTTSVVGQISNLVFSVVDGALVASGTFTATDTVPGASADFLGALVTATQASCSILDLTLGPLDLDLLGLEVHLDQVNLVIEATPGNGNLLGNLLCAVANLLNGGILNNGLANLLNRIVGLLGGLLG